MLLKDPQWMAIVNVTPDSFSDGGQWSALEDLYSHALEACLAGAHFLDLGAESSRPDASPIRAVLERQRLERVLPLIQDLRRQFPQLKISVDTVKPSVAEWALNTGLANAINDVSGGRFIEAAHPKSMLQVVADYGVPYVLMHRRGTPDTMNDLAHYQDVVAEVTHELAQSLEKAFNAGIKAQQLWIDVGIGFAKTPEQCVALLQHLPAIKASLGGLPLLLGVSRKRVTSHAGQLPPLRREATTAMWHHYAFTQLPLGTVDMYRVHDLPQQKAAWDWWQSVTL